MNMIYMQVIESMIWYIMFSTFTIQFKPNVGTYKCIEYTMTMEIYHDPWYGMGHVSG